MCLWGWVCNSAHTNGNQSSRQRIACEAACSKVGGCKCHISPRFSFPRWLNAQEDLALRIHTAAGGDEGFISHGARWRAFHFKQGVRKGSHSFCFSGLPASELWVPSHCLSSGRVLASCSSALLVISNVDDRIKSSAQMFLRAEGGERADPPSRLPLL